MTAAMDLLFNIESLIIFGNLDQLPNPFHKYPNLTSKHIWSLVINSLKIALSCLCLFLAYLLKK